MYRVLPTPQSAVTRAGVADTVRILEQRADQFGLPNSVLPTGPNLISVALPDVQSIHRVEGLLGTTARLEFYDWEANALTPSGRTVASLLLAHQPTAAIEISQGMAPGPPGSAGAGSMPLYRAVRLAAKQPYSAGKDNARAGPEYFAFGAPGSTACATAARDQHTLPFVGEHCYLAGPADTLRALYASLPPNVRASQAQLLTVQRGTVVLQALPASFTDAPAWSDPTAQFYVLRDHASLFGTSVTNPRQSTDQAGQPNLTLGFNGTGSNEYQKLTAQVAHRGALLNGGGTRLNQHFAVALDTQLLTVPLIDATAYPNGIPGNTGAAIFGPFTIQSARDLATELRFGALPLNLRLIAVVPHR